MPRQNRIVEGLIPGSCKIRKRGCSSSSSSSSVLQNYRFKRAILVGKAVRGSRSSTPVPSWRTTAAAAAESPKYAPSLGGRSSRPVSARKLAATLWEMNEIPSPRVVENTEERKLLKREMRVRERMGSLPPHLSDPSHSPVSEKMERSGTSSRLRTPSVSHQLWLADKNTGMLNSLSSASLMEMETRSARSRAPTPSGPGVGIRARLKDVSSALTTSKELLKIVSRIWARDDQPSSSMSLISALHAELERARLQVNNLIQEHRSDQNEITHLIKCFAEEKAAWKTKEHRVVESAIESIAGELDIERKLRRRLESLNKKLGKELSETKESLMKSVKELEREKRARGIMEQVCDDLAGNIGEDKEEVEELKRVSEKIHEEVDKEREMLHLADMLREERVQMKLSEAKHQFEEKNAAVDKLKNQLEAFMKLKKGKDKGRSSVSRTCFDSHQNEVNEDDGEVENGFDCEEGSVESDLHSIELNMDSNNKSYKWANFSGSASRVSIDNEIKGRNSTLGRPPRQSASLQRSISDGVEWADQSESIRKLDESLDRERLYELEKQAQKKGLMDRILSRSRVGSVKDLASPNWQWGDSVQERHSTGHMSNLTSRLAAEARGEGQAARRSRR